MTPFGSAGCAMKTEVLINTGCLWMKRENPYELGGG